MIMILTALSGLVGLVNLACLIVFLIQLFKAKGAGHGIAGFCCGLYTLIWGWQNADALDANNPPPAGMKYAQWIRIWTGCIVVSVVLNVATQAMARM